MSEVITNWLRCDGCGEYSSEKGDGDVNLLRETVKHDGWTRSDGPMEPPMHFLGKEITYTFDYCQSCSEERAKA